MAITPDTRHLLLPAGLGDRGIAAVISRKEAVLEHLRDTQLSEAGIYKVVPKALLDELRASPYVYVAALATANSPYANPVRLPFGFFIGTRSWQKYRAAHPQARLNTRPRIRALATYTASLGACVWDLDSIADEGRHALLTAALEDKIVAGHDLGRDLAWLFRETSARPKMVLDSSLLLRLLNPKSLLSPLRQALAKDPAIRQRAVDALAKSHGKPATSLNYVAASFRFPPFDYSFDESQSWAVTVLSPAHRAFAESKLNLARHVVSHVMPDVDMERSQLHLDHHAPWYASYATALLRFAEMHARGIPFDVEAASTLGVTLGEQIKSVVSVLAEIPVLAPIAAQLASESVGETSQMKEALLKATEQNPDVVVHLDGLRSLKYACCNLKALTSAAQGDGRLHPLVTFAAVTGRTSSVGPNVQGLPGDDAHRRLVRASAGCLILATDYTAIELRIASRLAERAIIDIRQRLKNDPEEDCWFMKLVRQGVNSRDQLGACTEAAQSRQEWERQTIPLVAQRVVPRETQPLAELFSRGLDPHLVTAMEMVRRAGLVNIAGPVPNWLAGMDASSREELQITWKTQRQQAKSANFGLLYGMKAEGLHDFGISKYKLAWTLAEAEAATKAWFEVYPEIRLWHLWTEYLTVTPVAPGRCKVWDRYRDQLVSLGRHARLYKPTTLSGRPIAVLEDRCGALNYQAQGTAADILASATAELCPEIARMLLVPVHDELVFEVPREQAVAVKREVEETMIRAAERVLGQGVQVKTTLSETWAG